jgi:exonuclease VII large subunit
MDDRKVIRFCLIGSVLSVALLYFLVLQVGSQNVKVGEVTGSLAGRTVNVTGYASDVYLHKNGHVFFNLKDGEDKVRVVIWESIVEELKYAGTEISGIKDGDKIQIVGTVELYQGEPEIIPVRAQVTLL